MECGLSFAVVAAKTLTFVQVVFYKILCNLNGVYQDKNRIKTPDKPTEDIKRVMSALPLRNWSHRKYILFENRNCKVFRENKHRLALLEPKSTVDFI